jgi:hypothetical protein
MSRLSPEIVLGRKFVVSVNMCHQGSCCLMRTAHPAFLAPLCMEFTLLHFLFETFRRILHIRSHMRESCIEFGSWRTSSKVAQPWISLSLRFLNYEMSIMTELITDITLWMPLNLLTDYLWNKAHKVFLKKNGNLNKTLLPCVFYKKTARVFITNFVSLL